MVYVLFIYELRAPADLFRIFLFFLFFFNRTKRISNLEEVGEIFRVRNAFREFKGATIDFAT